MCVSVCECECACDPLQSFTLLLFHFREEGHLELVAYGEQMQRLLVGNHILMKNKPQDIKTQPQ